VRNVACKDNVIIIIIIIIIIIMIKFSRYRPKSAPWASARLRLRISRVSAQ
jgi:hypothetical protein